MIMITIISIIIIIIIVIIIIIIIIMSIEMRSSGKISDIITFFISKH